MSIEQIRKRKNDLNSYGDWKIAIHYENYGQGYGAHTFYVNMAGDLLKIGVSETEEDYKKYLALATFIAHSKEDISELLILAEFGPEGDTLD